MKENSAPFIFIVIFLITGCNSQTSQADVAEVEKRPHIPYSKHSTPANIRKHPDDKEYKIAYRKLPPRFEYKKIGGPFLIPVEPMSYANRNNNFSFDPLSKGRSHLEKDIGTLVCALFYGNFTCSGISHFGHLDYPLDLGYVQDIHISDRNICVKADNKLRCWGHHEQSSPVLPFNKEILSLASHRNIFCALTKLDVLCDKVWVGFQYKDIFKFDRGEEWNLTHPKNLQMLITTPGGGDDSGTACVVDSDHLKCRGVISKNFPITSPENFEYKLWGDSKPNLCIKDGPNSDLKCYTLIKEDNALLLSLTKEHEGDRNTLLEKLREQVYEPYLENPANPRLAAENEILRNPLVPAISNVKFLAPVSDDFMKNRFDPTYSAGLCIVTDNYTYCIEDSYFDYHTLSHRGIFVESPIPWAWDQSAWERKNVLDVKLGIDFKTFSAMDLNERCEHSDNLLKNKVPSLFSCFESIKTRPIIDETAFFDHLFTLRKNHIVGHRLHTISRIDLPAENLVSFKFSSAPENTDDKIIAYNPLYYGYWGKFYIPHLSPLLNKPFEKEYSLKEELESWRPEVKGCFLYSSGKFKCRGMIEVGERGVAKFINASPRFKVINEALYPISTIIPDFNFTTDEPLPPVKSPPEINVLDFVPDTEVVVGGEQCKTLNREMNKLNSKVNEVYNSITSFMFSGAASGRLFPQCWSDFLGSRISELSDRIDSQRCSIKSKESFLNILVSKTDQIKQYENTLKSTFGNNATKCHL